MQSSVKNFRIFWVLIVHDFKLLGESLKSAVLGSINPLISQVITFGYLFPLMGMPASMIAPVYLGSMLSLLMQLGFTLTVKTGFDLTYNRFIDYHLALPLQKRWLFAAYIINNMIEVGLATIPLFVVGIFILSAQFNFAQMSYIGLFATGLLILAFFSTFYLTIAYSAQLRWIIDNAWPRIIIPLWTFSSALILWKKAYAWSPFLGGVMLLSPFTYVAEGLRSTMLGNQEYIPWQWCCLALIVFNAINIVVLTFGLKKRLDPV